MLFGKCGGHKKRCDVRATTIRRSSGPTSSPRPKSCAKPTDTPCPRVKIRLRDKTANIQRGLCLPRVWQVLQCEHAENYQSGRTSDRRPAPLPCSGLYDQAGSSKIQPHRRTSRLETARFAVVAGTYLERPEIKPLWYDAVYGELAAKQALCTPQQDRNADDARFAVVR